LEFPDLWSKDTYWETLALPIINELYYRHKMRDLSRFERDVIMANGKIKLAEKIKILKQYPGLTFSDFGTRRRFSREWQYYVVQTLAEELPGQFLGTSNVRAAMDFGQLPMGTSAHETYMAMTGIMHDSDDTIRASHNKVLQEWWAQYGYGLSIALTDTFGTGFFFSDMTEEQAKKWKGLRHDSGDPIKFGEDAIKFYEGYGINPQEKLLVFSDGLDLQTMIKIYLHFRGRIKVTFGWGTNLTNDMGFMTLSLVIKVIESCGHGTVKLTDNLAKAMGSPENVERFKRIFNHIIDTFIECKV
jgi:nicotinate phosphoribosyltransferase